MRASQAGSAVDLRTSIWAARWKTTSAVRGRPGRASPRASRMSASTSSAAGARAVGQVLALAGGEVVDDRHLVAALDQRVDEVRADEAGAAGDECPHRGAL